MPPWVASSLDSPTWRCDVPVGSGVERVHQCPGPAYAGPHRPAAFRRPMSDRAGTSGLAARASIRLAAPGRGLVTPASTSTSRQPAEKVTFGASLKGMTCAAVSRVTQPPRLRRRVVVAPPMAGSSRSASSGSCASSPRGEHDRRICLEHGQNRRGDRHSTLGAVSSSNGAFATDPPPAAIHLD